MNLSITSRHMEVDKKTGLYVNKKIGSLEKYLGKGDLPARASVILEEDAKRTKQRFMCEAILHLPSSGVISAKESTINIYASVDVVEAKLKAQLLKIKSKNSPWRRGHRLIKQLIDRLPGA